MWQWTFNSGAKPHHDELLDIAKARDNTLRVKSGFTLTPSRPVVLVQGECKNSESVSIDNSHLLTIIVLETPIVSFSPQRYFDFKKSNLKCSVLMTKLQSQLSLSIPLLFCYEKYNSSPMMWKRRTWGWGGGDSFFESLGRWHFDQLVHVMQILNHALA